MTVWMLSKSGLNVQFPFLVQSFFIVLDLCLIFLVQSWVRYWSLKYILKCLSITILCNLPLDFPQPNRLQRQRVQSRMRMAGHTSLRWAGNTGFHSYRQSCWGRVQDSSAEPCDWSPGRLLSRAPPSVEQCIWLWPLLWDQTSCQSPCVETERKHQ